MVAGGEAMCVPELEPRRLPCRWGLLRASPLWKRTG